jgi:Integrase core domain
LTRFGDNWAEGHLAARCTVERLMRRRGLQGVRRGKVVRTTVGDNKAPCPLDRVNRHFRAERPNQLWVSDFTYVSTWQGWLYVAFVIDVFARRTVGRRVSSSMRTDFVLDAPEQALCARQPERDSSFIHHSDRGSQYASIRYSERLAKAGIKPSVGSKGDSYERSGRDDQRAVQGRTDPSPRAVEDEGGRRIGHARMGRLVQQPSPARTYRLHTSRKGWGKLLPASRQSSQRCGGLTQTKQPPRNPGRFRKARSSRAGGFRAVNL